MTDPQRDAARPPALVLIDVQRGFDEPVWGERNNPDAEDRIAKLLTKWRERSWPIIHVQHASQFAESPLHPDRPGHRLKDIARPRGVEPLFVKGVNSAFIGTGLEAHLHDSGIDQLVIVGLTTNHCVSTTTRMAENLGFTAYVVSDATAAFAAEGPEGKRYSADEIHSVSLASLQGEFAQVVTAERALELP